MLCWCPKTMWPRPDQPREIRYNLYIYADTALEFRLGAGGTSNIRICLRALRGDRLTLLLFQVLTQTRVFGFQASNFVRQSSHFGLMLLFGLDHPAPLASPLQLRNQISQRSNNNSKGDANCHQFPESHSHRL